jgi:hypothetical protein
LQSSLFKDALRAPHLQTCIGATTAFVFSCPGQKEELLGYPCAGQTGRNLAQALPMLHELMPSRFQSVNRDGYVITNSWSEIEYKKKTGRSEATQVEILGEPNLRRLHEELVGMETILICGGKAASAVLRLRDSDRLAHSKVGCVMHLSFSALNTRKDWVGKSTEQRLALWAAEAVRQFTS